MFETSVMKFKLT